MSTSTTSTTTTVESTKHPLVSNPSSNAAHKFVTLLHEFTLPDIKQLLSIGAAAEAQDAELPEKHPNRGKGRCATALVTLCFSAIEEIGLFFVPNVDQMSDVQIENLHGATKAEAFFQYAHSCGIRAVPKDEVEAIYTVFRNHITHNLLPRFDVAITLSPKLGTTDPVLLISNVEYTLNVAFLAGAVIAVIDQLDNDVRQNPASNFHQAQTMDHLFKRLFQMADQKVKNKLGNLPGMRPYLQQWLKDPTL